MGVEVTVGSCGISPLIVSAFLGETGTEVWKMGEEGVEVWGEEEVWNHLLRRVGGQRHGWFELGPCHFKGTQPAWKSRHQAVSGFTQGCSLTKTVNKACRGIGIMAGHSASNYREKTRTWARVGKQGWTWKLSGSQLSRMNGYWSHEIKRSEKTGRQWEWDVGS